MVICAIYGCSTRKDKNKELSFYAVKRPRDLDWQKQLVQAIQMTRDDRFNVDTAVICSRHFKDQCFKIYGEFYDLCVKGYMCFMHALCIYIF